MAATAAILLAGALSAAPRYAVTEIYPETELRSRFTADINGDGLGDLVLGVWSDVHGRELAVHLQQRDGALSRVADRRIALKSDIIAVAVADVREEPGAELLLFTRSACYGYSTMKEGYADNARKLFDCELICAVPHRKEILHLDSIVDLDSDGTPDVVVPVDEGWEVFRGRRDGPLERVARFALPALDSAAVESGRRRERRISMGTRPNRRDRYRDRRGSIVAAWEEVGVEAEGSLLESERWVPGVFLADADGSGRLDLAFFEPGGGGGAVKVYLQSAEGVFAKVANWSATIDDVSSLWTPDVDGDGRFDLIAGKSDSSDETTLRIFENDDGAFDGGEPDQVLKLSGYGVEPHVVDVDGDDKVELVVESFSLSTGNVLKGGSVVRTVLVYRRGTDRPFGQRPTSRRDETFSAGEAKALSQRVSFAADVLGTGGRQALHTDREGALVARSFDASLRLEEQPSWRFVPGAAILELSVISLNDDGRSDLILRHVKSLTVLVSR
jgi:hypothetical protein